MRIDWAGSRSALSLAVAALTLGSGGAALAQTGQPAPWQMNFQTPVTNIAQQVVSFHNLLLWLITFISVFVLFLLVYVCWKFNEKANPVPSKTTHHTWIEVAWTVIPVLILVGISIPSFRILREQLTVPKGDVVLKATGHAWYWSYEYPADQGGIRFESNMVPTEDLKPGQPRLLSVDNEVVVPVNKIIRVQITAADVLHNFAVPSFGIRLDAVPGRLNETWFKAEREGVYYGQCSELCGNGHPYMPIQVRVVNDAQYAAWLEEAKKKFASVDGSGSAKLADAAR
ncbi:cytochrome c oxidase subunit II [Salinarimonas soli]|uniref:Cytochrome c oxidase subunit 2 n=1 Tax=Salinarimonas soli TaxID=1638099 RepID=A0A5B2V6G8_9HYPH|nr:cytochrome c oxidase subunit II [Salinarimonas soli]KAA2234110.1 cytochrome c oxidase subunit II [Salinarimonas soli]